MASLFFANIGRRFLVSKSADQQERLASQRTFMKKDFYSDIHTVSVLVTIG